MEAPDDQGFRAFVAMVYRVSERVSDWYDAIFEMRLKPGSDSAGWCDNRVCFRGFRSLQISHVGCDKV